MRKAARLALVAGALPLAAADWNYPVAKTVDQVDDYHGTKVADPYRWLEELDSTDTRAWIRAERAQTETTLARMPEREAIRRRLTELWNYPRYGLPYKEAGWYFYTKNDGLQNQAPLYVQRGLDGEPRVFIDPNTLSADGTVALTTTSPSHDGRWLGYGLAKAGSDWNEFHVREVATGRDAPDVIRWVKFSGMSWTDDHRGFFYGRYPEPKAGDSVFSKLVNRRLYYHRLGTPQSEDRLIFALPEHPEWSFNGQVTADGRYLVLSVRQNARLGNALYYLNLRDPQRPVFDDPVQKLVDSFEATCAVVGYEGGRFYVFTNAGAPRGRVVAVDPARPAAWTTVIPESKDIVRGVRLSAGKFVVTVMRDVISRVLVFDLAGKPQGEIPLPGVGSVGAVAGKAKDPEIFVSFSSFLFPGTILRHNLSTGKTDVWREARVAFDPATYETRQVFFPSKDGTRVPMFVTHRKGLKPDGATPTWLYAYGGFNIAMQPQFAVPPIVWLERGGIYAVANLRGGAEYGDAWHRAGTKERKQNVFDDYIAAADWLVAQGYTRHGRIVLDGRSNGGLLVGAVLNQRPDLGGAALPAVGVMDMLRYHKFTAGASWASDYGSSDDPAGFAYLRAYSPLHTVRAGAKYPPVLVTTGDHDDRVFPAHSYKYAAAMQAAVAAGGGPVLIRIETNAGHGGSSGTTPVTKTIDEWADRMGFAAHFTGAK